MHISFVAQKRMLIEKLIEILIKFAFPFNPLFTNKWNRFSIFFRHQFLVDKKRFPFVSIEI